jgi:hypothetical protein
MIDQTIDRLVKAGEPVTLAALGGMQAITVDDTTSPMFPYVAEAIAEGWDQLGAEERVLAARRIAEALRGLASGVALDDVAKAVVPSAERLGIVREVKDALRARATDRVDERTGAMAATALRWLTHLAITAPEARHALLDVLTGVATDQKAESMPFAVAASQMSSVAHDHWRETSAKECLERLTDGDAEADAWFGLGQALLADALDCEDRDSMVAGLREAHRCFANAVATGEERPDAAIYVNTLRFLALWADRAPAEMLQPHLDAAEQALQEYLLLGYRLPDQPMWLRPRFEAETAWIDLVHRMRAALAGETSDAWLHAVPVLDALADAYRAANALRPLRTVVDQPSPSFGDLLVPRLSAPLVEHQARLALLDRWVRESDALEAGAFRDLIRTQAAMPPKARPPGLIRR